MLEPGVGDGATDLGLENEVVESTGVQSDVVSKENFLRECED